MKAIKTVLSLSLVFLLSACYTPQKIAYFQDTSDVQNIKLQAEQVFRLRPEDKINIVVNSKDPALASLFTLTSTSSNVLGSTSTPKTTAGRSGGSSQTTIAYTVDDQGNIDFPVLGSIHAQGKTRQELASYIKNELIRQQLVLDPIVTVEYVNISVSILGEVSSPGRIDVTNDHFTILDAISKAGDLTINGERDSVKVIRNVDGNLTTYNINLCSAQNIVNSPAYYLQQNDVVYVTPNIKRKRESTVNGNTVVTPSFWISVASFLTTITVLILR